MANAAANNLKTSGDADNTVTPTPKKQRTPATYVAAKSFDAGGFRYKAAKGFRVVSVNKSDFKKARFDELIKGGFIKKAPTG
ncbi:MAG: hypothetical protein ACR2MD_01030 [Aridibacter sp.]